jgi:hypothetical protein
MGALIDEYDRLDHMLSGAYVQMHLAKNDVVLYQEDKDNLDSYIQNIQDAQEELEKLSHIWYETDVLGLRRKYAMAKAYFDAFSNLSEDYDKMEAAYNILVKSDGFVDDPDDDESEEGYQRALDLLRTRRDTAAKNLLGPTTLSHTARRNDERS